MRAAAALLVTVLVMVPFAGMFPPAKPCCCASLRNGSCPLEKPRQQSCGDHRSRSCSIDPDGGAAPAQAQSDLRVPVTAPSQSTFAIAPVPIAMNLSDHSSRLCDRDVPPELPPPRRA
jgi:hypothetical protein